MIGRLLPEAAACWEVFGERPAFPVYRAEEAAVRGRAPGRRREFAGGRYCAHRALERLGVPAGAVPAGERGAPRWPRGVVGSITHCRGYTAAAVARSGGIAALGIDAEPQLPLPPDVLEHIAGPGERARVRALLAERPGVCWDRLLFSAKESVYKAWFPAEGRFLGFRQARVSLGPAAGAFRVRIEEPGAHGRGRGALPAELAGRWACGRGVLVTAVAVPAGAGPVVPGPAGAVPTGAVPAVAVPAGAVAGSGGPPAAEEEEWG
ncbi:4'-phosphopantetheinyl transferase superfamily protein [Streptomyces sp. F63]|uniref:4'-phosphopantetheinyl transferase family protein n=1 Tax=Streptomyces sp. F63 TaxID=2824887 RepID=UPI001B3735C0|nr:4'-phosphopantetheinyl transferase superfamily protein [Streptomyces sp. F63]MBQ0986515.1 4'-phosphopantetheinyl transferase superfamily protein [Streptomyces sp. F63]